MSLVDVKLNSKEPAEIQKTSTTVGKQNSLEVITSEGEIVEEEINSPEIENVTKEERHGLLKVLTKAIGLDVTTITLPVSLNEPTSFLMRLCEQLQYSKLLDNANQLSDPVLRLIYVGIFAASVYSVAERTGKPFNPLLGETFEYTDEKRNNFRFISEQVSHHPPVGACHAENDHFQFWQTQQLKTKFTGNSLDCLSLGSTNVILKKWDEHYRWPALKTNVNNVIVGKIWLDHYGEIEIKNPKTGEKIILSFTKCGWFSKGWHDVSGVVYDAKGNAVINLFGKWNDSIFGKFALTPVPNSTSSKEIDNKQIENKIEKTLLKRLTTNKPLWRHKYKPLDPSSLPCKYMNEWTSHTLLIIKLTEELRNTLPPTDSRLRPDRLSLEKEDTKKAAAEKYILEEKQRAEARQRAALKQVWIPRWFIQSKTDEHDWIFNEKYWKDRAIRLQKK